MTEEELLKAKVFLVRMALLQEKIVRQVFMVHFAR
jgi:hypothetical protein